MYWVANAMMVVDRKFSQEKYEGRPDRSPSATPMLSMLLAKFVMHAGMQRNNPNVKHIKHVTTARENRKPSLRNPEWYPLPNISLNLVSL